MGRKGEFGVGGIILSAQVRNHNHTAEQGVENNVSDMSTEATNPKTVGDGDGDGNKSL